MRRLFDWVDDRLGYREAVRGVRTHPVAGGASWRHVFGAALLFAFGLQMVTGVLLAFHYSPSTTDAWSSLWYLQEKVTLGWFLRGLHHFGSMAVVVLLATHGVQTFVAGAYKKPRELNWIVGVLMAGVILAFAMTGWLLPWDQKGYYATKVATNLIGTVPLVGGHLQELLQGGNDYGHLTLSRFFALHVFVLPGILITLLLLHLRLFWRHGYTPSARLSPEEAVLRTQPLWPHQVWRDAVFALLVFATIVGLTLAYRGAPLMAPADPSQPFEVARPEWYFLFLFQLLKYLPGGWQVVGTAVLPALAFLFLCALPFLDRGPERALAARKGWAAAVFGALVAVVSLMGLALYQDATDPHFAKKMAAAQAQARKIKAIAAKGIPPQGASALADPRSLFLKKCGTCHRHEGQGEADGPDLTGWGTRRWLKEFLANPRAPDKYGYRKSRFVSKGSMPNLKLSAKEMASITEWVFQEAGEPHDAKLAKEGRDNFDNGGCDMCHTYGKAAKAPNLKGWWSRRWLQRVLREPAHPELYGKRNQMKVPRLTELQRQLLIDWLLEGRKKEARPAAP